MENKKENRSNIIYKYYYFVITIIIAIFLGVLMIKCIWPKKFLEEEKYYYQEIAENAWNKGLKFISKEVTSINSNYLYIEPFDKTDTAVYIDFNKISKGIITIHIAKKGNIVYYFSEENETMVIYKSKYVPLFLENDVSKTTY